MLSSWVAVVAGLLLLVWGAERFVRGASVIAGNLGISPLIIGLTIVGLGTSAPEMIVSATASFQGSSGLAIGNALGSNITNIALVLGITALMTPLTVHSRTLRRELPIMLIIMLIAGALLSDGVLDQTDGLILVLGLVALIMTVLRVARRSRVSDPIIEEFKAEMPARMSTGKAVFLTIAGLLVLVLSSKLLVWGAVSIAQSLGISDLLIGLTIVAIGTSLPELATSVISAWKGEADIAIGNVIGSNMFNMLPVLGLPGLIAPGVFDTAVLSRDFPVMLGLSVVLIFMAYGIRGPGRINRFEGLVLLTCFCAYQFLLYKTAVMVV